ncbi:PorP/SprF family type IX secretion system membrane protein [Membranicola marinus]|uniref:PorP/SprF family type IX secretion system membrane protein n=1 Tax=Membranihabitans marinus TaxID=1227546 RepID=A0A953HPW0_9BACT|nr:PorP/SprF family type IX secretion system membrane protein [Membranihabitans marinus]MBY5959044.1 PorP/SprF family type IX secretion system membrane protein [Membranihabitans marinus]
MEKNVIKPVAVFLLLVTLWYGGRAQDFSYTQVFAHSSTLSPALTGLHNGQFKASMLYRNQWVKAVDKPFTMAGGYIDLRSKVPFKITSKDAFGIGLGFVAENQGVIDYSKNSFNINAAYHKALDFHGEHVLSAGAQLGFLQNSVGYENVTFMDQFDGTGFNLSTSEDLPVNTINSLDVGMGIHYQYARDEDLVSAGLSMFHINSPDISFGNNDENTLDETKNQLYRKYIGHFYYQASINRDLALTPRLIAKVQGPNQLAMAGSTARIRLAGGQNENAIHLGLFLQAGKTFDANFKLHTTSVLVGYEFNAFNVGLSYDVGLMNRYNFKSNPGNFELSLSYFGFLTDNTATGCPVF